VKLKTYEEALIEYLNYLYESTRGSVVTVSLRKFARFVSTRSIRAISGRRCINMWYILMDIIRDNEHIIHVIIGRNGKGCRAVVLYRKYIPQVIEELRRRLETLKKI